MPEPFTAIDASELGKEVPLGAIDSELRAMFVEDASLSRASLMNFAIYNENPGALGANTDIVRQLTREHACRSILIISEPGGDRSAQAWVQAHCNLSGNGGKAVCSEQVSFHLRGGGANLVRNTVFSHLDSDLPLVFWWQDELSDVFEERLYSRIDRLVFDSRSWSRPETQFLRLNGALEDDNASFIAHDLSYTRGSQVRTAIMSCFNEPRARAALATLNEITVRHRPGHRMSALWIAAWIGGRLGGKLDRRSDVAGEETERFHFQRSSSGHAPFAIDLQLIDVTECKAEPGEAAALAEVELRADDFEFSIQRREDADFWNLRIVLGKCPPIEELIPARPCGDAFLVNEVLSRAGRNRAMLELLPLLRRMLAA